MTLAVAVVVVAVAAIVILTSTHRARILSFLVGASSGLVAAQILNIHVFSVFVIAWAFTTPRRPERGGALLSALPLVFMIPIALTAFTGDLVNNRGLAAQFIVLGLGAWIIGARADKVAVGDMLRGLLVVCSAASLMSLGQYAHVLPNKGFHTDVIAAGRPYAFYPEPDWAGLFSTLGILLAYRTMQSRTALFYAVLLLNAAGSVVVAARAAWLALAVSVVLAMAAGVIGRRSEQRRKGAIGGVVVLAIVGGALLSQAPALRSELSARVNSLVHVNTETDVSGRARQQQTDGLLNLIHTAPWNGHGVSASGHVGVSGVYDVNATNSVGSNWVLSLLVDAKYLAVPFILLLLGLAAVALRTTAGIMLAFLCVHNLFTNATVQPITWLAIGVTIATVVGVRTSRRTGPSGTSRPVQRPLAAARG